MERAIHLMGETLWSKTNSGGFAIVDRHDAVRCHRTVFGCGARNYADAIGSHHYLRAGRRKGGAERGHCIHNSNGVSNKGAASIFR